MNIKRPYSWIIIALFCVASVALALGDGVVWADVEFGGGRRGHEGPSVTNPRGLSLDSVMSAEEMRRTNDRSLLELWQERSGRGSENRMHIPAAAGKGFHRDREGAVFSIPLANSPFGIVLEDFQSLGGVGFPPKPKGPILFFAVSISGRFAHGFPRPLMFTRPLGLDPLPAGRWDCSKAHGRFIRMACEMIDVTQSIEELDFRTVRLLLDLFHRAQNKFYEEYVKKMRFSYREVAAVLRPLAEQMDFDLSFSSAFPSDRDLSKIPDGDERMWMGEIDALVAWLRQKGSRADLNPMLRRRIAAVVSLYDSRTQRLQEEYDRRVGRWTITFLKELRDRMTFGGTFHISEQGKTLDMIIQPI